MKLVNNSQSISLKYYKLSNAQLSSKTPSVPALWERKQVNRQGVPDTTNRCSKRKFSVLWAHSEGAPTEKVHKEVTPKLYPASLPWNRAIIPRGTSPTLSSTLCPPALGSTAAPARFLAVSRIDHACFVLGSLPWFLLPKKLFPQIQHAWLPRSFSFCSVVSTSFEVVVSPNHFIPNFNLLTPSARPISHPTLRLSLVLIAIHVLCILHTSLLAVFRTRSSSIRARCLSYLDHSGIPYA